MRKKSKFVSVTDIALYASDKERYVERKRNPNQKGIAIGNAFHDNNPYSPIRNTFYLLLFIGIAYVLYNHWDSAYHHILTVFSSNR